MCGVKLNEKKEKWKTQINVKIRTSQFDDQEEYWDGLDTLELKMIVTGSNVVWRGKLKELDREDAQKRSGCIVLRMTRKV